MKKELIAGIIASTLIGGQAAYAELKPTIELEEVSAKAKTTSLTTFKTFKDIAEEVIEEYEAQKEADGIVKEAENRIISMIDEHEITRKAYEQKAEIIETANEMSREISQGTKEYANNLLNSTEKVLTDSLAKLEKDISEAANIMQMSLEGTIKTIQDSKKELQ